ncbi:hypothetical protein MFMK1_001927 [Metallumcola ferriviriculae]|uniref:Uncharacterized protein n=1 Tax=Metallumcola ferriviriculae TaxID=3039180 RepID=A0AAU0UMU1_9FIRM|nr:hypothetical protein MFMK1_001927 [Desulfitibacteraceae bacterium MK1]
MSDSILETKKPPGLQMRKFCLPVDTEQVIERKGKFIESGIKDKSSKK